MINNDVFCSVCYMFNVNDIKIIEIIKLVDFEVDNVDVVNFFKKEDEVGYQDCFDLVMVYFFNGLIFFRCGKDDKFLVFVVELVIINNIVLKKLCVVFELKDIDMYDVFNVVEFLVFKFELNVLFCKEGSKNFCLCGDQVLCYFFKGLILCICGFKKQK